MQSIDAFLKEIEGRAFRIAMLATHSEADALDLVQDAMMKLVTKYADRPYAEYKPLFLKILENKITDWHRKESFKKSIFFWRRNEETELESEESSELVGVDENTNPELELDTEQLGKALIEVIEAMPLKQQQCFVLRTWEDLSVKQTAEIMNISESTVKTHCLRAVEKLKATQQVMS